VPRPFIALQPKNSAERQKEATWEGRARSASRAAKRQQRKEIGATAPEPKSIAIVNKTTRLGPARLPINDVNNNHQGLPMRRIINMLLTAGLLGAGGGVASAADMPLKAPPLVPVVPSWAGFYIGGDVGVRWSTARWTTNNFGAFLPSAVDNPANLNSTDFRGGGYIGYNWMLSPTWLVGLEADVGSGGSNVTHSPFPGVAVFPGLFPAGMGHDFVNARLGWDGSVRGRVGVLVSPTWLLYGTGGVAWQRISTSASCDGSPPSFCSPPGFASFSATTKAGWTLGAGAEAKLWSSNWIGRVEYRYADFGSVTNNLPPAPIVGFNASVRVTTNTTLVGLAYKFGN
jgi:outer membrane immunogenic protein